MFVSNEFNYRVAVKRSDHYQRYNRARLGVSVGTTKYEGGKLRAALEWAYQRFSDVELRVSDTLQRYNMPGDPDKNWAMARMVGDAWIERNKDILADFPSLHMYRWDDVLANPMLPQHHAKIIDLLSKDDFRQAFHQDMADFLHRRGGGDPDKCRQFMIEELAVFDMLQQQHPAADIYPGTFLNCRRLMRDDFALTRIDFVRVPKVEHHDLAA